MIVLNMIPFLGKTTSEEPKAKSLSLRMKILDVGVDTNIEIEINIELWIHSPVWLPKFGLREYLIFYTPILGIPDYEI